MDINQIFKIAVEQKASDIHLVSGLRPILRIDGNLISIDKFQSMPDLDMIDNSFDNNIGKEQDLLSENNSNQKNILGSYEDTGNSVERFVLSEDDELISSEISKNIS